MAMQFSEAPAGEIFVDGQRCEILVRSEAQEDGTWHNALVFRRDGRVTGRELLMTGVDWHVAPPEAVARALGLTEDERMELFRRAARPRAPLL